MIYDMLCLIGHGVTIGLAVGSILMFGLVVPAVFVCWITERYIGR